VVSPDSDKIVICDCTIENRFHYVRDVTFAEDRSRIRTDHAPHLLVACRNLAITLIYRSGSSHIAAARRSFSYHPRAAFDLLLSRASPSNNSQALPLALIELGALDHPADTVKRNRKQYGCFCFSFVRCICKEPFMLLEIGCTPLSFRTELPAHHRE
jgi:hypothetical protein